MDVMGWSNSAMVKRCTHVTARLRWDIADRLNTYLWAANETTNETESAPVRPDPGGSQALCLLRPGLVVRGRVSPQPGPLPAGPRQATHTQDLPGCRWPPGPDDSHHAESTILLRRRIMARWRQIFARVGLAAYWVSAGRSPVHAAPACPRACVSCPVGIFRERPCPLPPRGSPVCSAGATARNGYDGAGVPDLAPGEPRCLGVHAQRLVVGDSHGLRHVPPGGGFPVAHTEFAGAGGLPFGRVGGAEQVCLRHQVGVDVVVGDGAVLVRAGDPVDVEAALIVVVAEGDP